MEIPRNDKRTPRSPASTRAPPVMKIKNAATAQIIIASIISQPAMSCQAGRVSR